MKSDSLTRSGLRGVENQGFGWGGSGRVHNHSVAERHLWERCCLGEGYEYSSACFLNSFVNYVELLMPGKILKIKTRTFGGLKKVKSN